MKLLKEPLLHFILLGAILFALGRGMDRETTAPGPADSPPVIGPDAIVRAAAEFEKLHTRPPTGAELRELADRLALDEAYVREARRRGLDRDDPIIRRRLREKLASLHTDLMAVTGPGEGDLQKYLEANPEVFREDPRIDFRQIFFDPEKLGEPVEPALGEALRKLRAGEPVAGHPSLLPESRGDAPLRSIAATFGKDFAGRLTDLPDGEWHGPLRSGFGLHLVKVENRVSGRVPPLEEIREKVRREWADARLREMTEAFHRELLDRHPVEIEWPGKTPPGS